MPPPSALPPNPSLVAILLVIRTPSGEKLVFHYPPHPKASSKSSASARHGSHYSGTSFNSSGSEWSSESGETSDQDDDDVEIGGGGQSSVDFSDGRSGAQRSGRRRKKVHLEDAMEAESSTDENDDEDRNGLNRRNGGPNLKTGGPAVDGEKYVRNKKGGPVWDQLLGYSADGLQKLLSPGRAFHKKKFELAIEPLVFLGCPMHIREDGMWRKKKTKKKKPQESVDDEDATASALAGLTIETGEKLGTPLLSPVQEQSQLPPLIPKESASSNTGPGQRDLTMFNVVFVMNPPELEYAIRVHEMYNYVAKKLSLAFKYEQARNGFVYKESMMIMDMKDKAKEERVPMSSLWTSILARSQLARAIQETYVAIASSKIAQVELPASLMLSLQIPMIHSISNLPSLLEPTMTGLYLTTATAVPDDDDDDVPDEDPTSSANPAYHFALLLLHPPQKILADLNPAPANLALYLRHSKPTISLLQLSNLTSLSRTVILTLTNTLLARRVALAILPLSHRETYIVSPNAPMRQLHTANDAFSRNFPTMPTLPKILAFLSQGRPRPFKVLIPTKDHRELWLEVLAWLVRGGWVTHLRSFGWLRVNTLPKVETNGADHTRATSVSSPLLLPQMQQPVSLIAAAAAAAGVGNATVSTPGGVGGSSSSSQILGRGPPSIASTAATVVNPDTQDLNTGIDELLPHPLRPTPEQSLALEALRDRIFPKAYTTAANNHKDSTASKEDTKEMNKRDNDKKADNDNDHDDKQKKKGASNVGVDGLSTYGRQHFMELLRHFDGKHSLEKISLLEEGRAGSRKDVRQYLEALEKGGGLVAGRWW